MTNNDHGFWRPVLDFFLRAMDLVKSRLMKFLMVLIVAALLAPQVVSRTANPTLALVLVFFCIVLFGFFALALELRDRQRADLDDEVEALKDQLRQLAQETRGRNQENDLLKKELRRVARKKLGYRVAS